MQKLDKIVAGLLVVAMAVFWMAISPAGITSKPSEAMPVSIDTAIQGETAPVTAQKRLRDRPMTESQKRRRDAGRVDAAQVERLSRRKRDTPFDGGEQMREGLSQPAIRPVDQDIESLPRFDDLRDRPVFN